MATHIFFYFHPETWGRFPIWRSYFFRWVGSTTNQIRSNMKLNQKHENRNCIPGLFYLCHMFLQVIGWLVVWSCWIPENERDCHLMVPLETQTTNLSFVDFYQFKDGILLWLFFSHRWSSKISIQSPTWNPSIFELVTLVTLRYPSLRIIPKNLNLPGSQFFFSASFALTGFVSVRVRILDLFFKVISVRIWIVWDSSPICTTTSTMENHHGTLNETTMEKPMEKIITLLKHYHLGVHIFLGSKGRFRNAAAVFQGIVGNVPHEALELWRQSQEYKDFMLQAPAADRGRLRTTGCPNTNYPYLDVPGSQ